MTRYETTLHQSISAKKAGKVSKEELKLNSLKKRLERSSSLQRIYSITEANKIN